MAKIGKSRYGAEFVRRKYFKLKDGESIFRILPAMGDLGDAGTWSVFHKVHYGYKSGDDKHRPFLSPLIKNNKTKMIEVPDAALERIQGLQASLEKAKKEANVPMATKISALLQQYNLDSNHYLNVLDQQGNIGILKIRHRCKVALDAEIKRLREKEGVDPLSVDNGRFFVFRRSGTALDTAFSVSVLKEKLNVPGVGNVERDVVHTLTDEIIDRCLSENKDGIFTYKEAANLHTLFKKLTSAEVERIVKEGSIAIDEIFNTKSQTTAVTETDDGDDYEEETQVTQTAAPVVTPNVVLPAPVQAVVPPTPAAVAPKAESLTSTKTTAQVLSEQSEEDFLKSLGL